MNILILTQYYLPETGAPQNRLSSLASYLQQAGSHVEVLTAMPNYPKYQIYPSYKGKWYCTETIDGIPVHHAWIFVSKKKGLVFRLLNYFSFTISAFFFASVRQKKYDVIICESPPLFLGITAVLLKKIWNCKLVFNVSDLWPESVEKMGIIQNKWIINKSYKLANWIYRNAHLISGQTKGILDAIQQMQPQKDLFWFPNGVDLHKFQSNSIVNKKTSHQFCLLYAGIIGHAQGLEVILQAANKLKEHAGIHFYIIGDGPVKDNLLALQQELSLSNITFISNLPSVAVWQWLHECDAYIVPLRKLDLFKGAIPSKLFEPLVHAKPILLGVDGEARQLFIDEGKGGLYFEPENAHALADAIWQLYQNPTLAKQLGESGQKYVINHFNREHISLQFHERIKQLFATSIHAN